MNIEKLRKQSASELKDELLQLRRKQFNLRMQQATGQSARTHEFRVARRDIARIKTVLNEMKNADQQTAKSE
ncbi:MAG: 50S ribosomal protein L29 [Gammaproteobacteria bacterium]|nr:50S ribosomal protein L29 [Gammaproteobacteria bacterium]